MKRILYVGGFELPDKNAAAHRVLAIGKAWRDGGIEVVFLGVSKENTQKNILKTETLVQGFSAYSVPYPNSKKEWIKYLSNIDSVKKLVEFYGHFDGIVCYNYQAIAFERLRKYCNAKGIKIYADCTEWYNTDGASFAFKVLKGFDTWYRMAVVQKKLDGMIAISNYLKNYYGYCKNVMVIPPLVDCKEEKWTIEAKQLGNSVNFIYAGQPGHKDKISEIIVAYKNVAINNNCKLWIVGISKEQCLKSNPELQIEGIPESVIFLGRISHQESISYLKGADCSLIIRDSTRTNNAGFPTKFAEAVTLGIGVIATNISDLREYSEKLDNVFIVDGPLCDAMKSFISTDKYTKKNNSLFDYRNWTKKLVLFLNAESAPEIS